MFSIKETVLYISDKSAEFQVRYIGCREVPQYDGGVVLSRTIQELWENAPSKPKQPVACLRADPTGLHVTFKLETSNTLSGHKDGANILRHPIETVTYFRVEGKLNPRLFAWIQHSRDVGKFVCHVVLLKKPDKGPLLSMALSRAFDKSYVEWGRKERSLSHPRKISSSLFVSSASSVVGGGSELSPSSSGSASCWGPIWSSSTPEIPLTESIFETSTAESSSRTLLQKFQTDVSLGPDRMTGSSCSLNYSSSQKSSENDTVINNSISSKEPVPNELFCDSYSSNGRKIIQKYNIYQLESVPVESFSSESYNQNTKFSNDQEFDEDSIQEARLQEQDNTFHISTQRDELPLNEDEICTKEFIPVSILKKNENEISCGGYSLQEAVSLEQTQTEFFDSLEFDCLKSSGLEEDDVTIPLEGSISDEELPVSTWDPPSEYDYQQDAQSTAILDIIETNNLTIMTTDICYL